MSCHYIKKTISFTQYYHKLLNNLSQRKEIMYFYKEYIAQSLFCCVLILSTYRNSRILLKLVKVK